MKGAFVAGAALLSACASQVGSRSADADPLAFAEPQAAINYPEPVPTDLFVDGRRFYVQMSDHPVIAATCHDGWVSYSWDQRVACAGHGGVRDWSNRAQRQTGALVPSEEVVRQGHVSSIWEEPSATDPNLIDITRPIPFSANSADPVDLRRAFDLLSATFPACPVPPELGYATWAHAGGLVILFEIRKDPGCPTNPMVSLRSNGHATAISYPDQALTFE